METLRDHRLLLEPGWAGDLTLAELAYIKGMLKAWPSIRARWGLTGKRPTEERVRRIARDGVGTAAKPPQGGQNKP